MFLCVCVWTIRGNDANAVVKFVILLLPSQGNIHAAKSNINDYMRWLSPICCQMHCMFSPNLCFYYLSVCWYVDTSRPVLVHFVGNDEFVSHVCVCVASRCICNYCYCSWTLESSRAMMTCFWAQYSDFLDTVGQGLNCSYMEIGCCLWVVWTSVVVELCGHLLWCLICKSITYNIHAFGYVFKH